MTNLLDLADAVNVIDRIGGALCAWPDASGLARSDAATMKFYTADWIAALDRQLAAPPEPPLIDDEPFVGHDDEPLPAQAKPEIEQDNPLRLPWALLVIWAVAGAVLVAVWAVFRARSIALWESGATIEQVAHWHAPPWVLGVGLSIVTAEIVVALFFWSRQ